MSERHEDASGYWEIKDKPISKAGVFPYLGANLLGAPDPLKIYMILRPAEELGSAETIASAKLQPWVIAHDMLGPKQKGLMPPEEKGVHGVTGEEVYFKPETGILYSNIKCFSERMKHDVENGVKGLSMGYFHDVDWTPGEWNGQRYDGRQTNIRFNHLALVPSGRMGPDVSLDSLQGYDPNIYFEEMSMTTEELVAAIKDITQRLEKLEGAKSAAGDTEDGAASGATPGASAGKDDAGTENPPAPEVVADALEQLAERLDRLEGDGSGAAADTADAAAKDNADTATQDNADAAGKDNTDAASAGTDTEDAAAKANEEKGASMDAALMHKNVLADLSLRGRLVAQLTPILGSFDHDLMTSLEVAAYACNKLGVPYSKGQAGTAIAAYLQGAAKAKPAQSFSMDSAASRTGHSPARSAKMNAYLEGK